MNTPNSIFAAGYAYFLKDDERAAVQTIADALPSELDRISSQDYHITLLKLVLGGAARINKEYYKKHEDIYLRRLRGVAETSAPFEITFDTFGVSDDAIFLYTLDERVQQLRDRLHKDLPVLEPYTYTNNFAHVTLARLTTSDDKNSLKRQLEATKPSAKITLSRISILHCNNLMAEHSEIHGAELHG